MNHQSADTRPRPDASFSALLEPVGVDDFFRDVFGQRPLHVPGPPEKFASYFSWSQFSRLLNMSKLWSDRSMKLVLDGRDVDPQDYSRSGMTREGNRALLPDPARVEALLGRGATIILDLVETLTPGVAALSRSLAAGTGSTVVCNAYCSFKAHQGFLAHFDTTDVFALHIEGRKVWRIYEGVARHPVDQPGYNYASLAPSEHAGAKGAVAMEVELTPGDLLYLPRGRYHEALAASEASLHLSFGAARPTGLDFMTLLARWIVEDPRFREYLPHFDDESGYARHLGGLGEGLKRWAQAPEVAERLRRWQRERAFRDGVHELDLPRVGGNPRYQVRRLGVALEPSPRGAALSTPKGRTSLSAAESTAVEALLGKDFIDRAVLVSLLEGIGADGPDAFIDKLIAAGLLAEV